MDQYLLAFWNLENLFAPPAGAAGREPWLAAAIANDLKGAGDPDAGWTDALFNVKVAQLTRVVASMGAGAGPDLLGVCEVENRWVLDQLAVALNAAVGGRAYAVVHADSTRDKRGIDTAFLYDGNRLTPKAGSLFSHFVMRRTGTRDITQSTFTTNRGHDLVALANHWPSRSGGHFTDSQGFRAVAGETLGYWHERIRDATSNDTAVVAMGDLNDGPGDLSVTHHANASRQRREVEVSTSARFFNLSWDLLRQQVVDKNGRRRLLYGTIYFKGEGAVFDQVLVSRSLLKGAGGFQIVDGSARIEAFPAMVSGSHKEGPIRFGLPKGDTARNVNLQGFSDHFPVSVRIDEL